VSGGIQGLPGTGRRSSRQAPPAMSAPIRRQNRAAPGFSSWKAISQRPGCSRNTCRTASYPTRLRRTARSTKNSAITRGSAASPRISANPAGSVRSKIR
jgi:hypothetical protein